MNKAKATEEPSIDDILASIRKAYENDPAKPLSAAPAPPVRNAVPTPSPTPPPTERRTDPFMSRLAGSETRAAPASPAARIDDDIADLLDEEPAVAAAPPQAAPIAAKPLASPTVASPKPDWSAGEPARITPSFGAPAPVSSVFKPSWSTDATTIGGSREPEPDPTSAKPVIPGGATGEPSPASLHAPFDFGAIVPRRPEMAAGGPSLSSPGAVKPVFGQTRSDTAMDRVPEPAAPIEPAPSRLSFTSTSAPVSGVARPVTESRGVMPATERAHDPFATDRATAVGPQVIAAMEPSEPSTLYGSEIKPLSAPVAQVAPAKPPEARLPQANVERLEALVDGLATAAAAVHSETPGSASVTLGTLSPGAAASAPAVALAPYSVATSATAVRSLEDVVADMLRPLLRQWLAENMPRIVERALMSETADRRKS